jgi:hypothetical protein
MLFLLKKGIVVNKEDILGIKIWKYRAEEKN